MLEDTLSGLGLSREEVQIYVALLESGQSTAGELAKRLGMARPTLYGILQRMTDKGIIIRSLRQGVRSFSAAEPESLDQI